MQPWIYGVAVTEQRGDYVVTVRDMPEVITSGDTLEEALELANDAIETAIAFRMGKGEELPRPSPLRDNEYPVPLSAKLMAKASVYSAWKASGLKKVELAQRMGRGEAEVRRILDPACGTKIDQMEEAARALGGRLVISYEQG